MITLSAIVIAWPLQHLKSIRSQQSVKHGSKQTKKQKIPGEMVRLLWMEVGEPSSDTYSRKQEYKPVLE